MKRIAIAAACHCSRIVSCARAPSPLIVQPRASLALSAPLAVARMADPATAATAAASATSGMHTLSQRFAGGLDHAPEALPRGVQFAAAADRNKHDIARALQPHINDSVKRLLELASGTGQHVAFFASQFPHTQFQPSDQSEEGFDSIAYHSRDHANVLPAVRVNVLEEDESKWTFERHSFDAVFVANMLHISASGTTAGLFRCARAALRPAVAAGKLLVYGPMKKDGAFTTESNRAFDEKLRNMNPEYGLRDIGAIADVGAEFGFRLTEVRDMPANNFLLAFEHTSIPDKAAAAAGTGAPSRSAPAASL